MGRTHFAVLVFSLVCGCGKSAPNLAAPTLTAELAGAGRVALRWSDVQAEVGYRIERRGPRDSHFSLLATVDADVVRFADEEPVGGTAMYRVVATAEELEGAPSNPVGIAVPLVPQFAEAQVDLQTLAVVVSEQPASFLLSATSSVPAPAAPHLDLELTVQNLTGHPVPTLEVVIDSVSDRIDEDVLVIGDGRHGDRPFVQFGASALAVGASRTATIRISGIDPTATLLDLEFTVAADPHSAIPIRKRSPGR